VAFLDNGIISQFEGYQDLQELDWARYRKQHGRTMRLDRILEAEDDTPNRYKAAKQADVLMLFYLFSAEELSGIFRWLGYDFDPKRIPRNVHYYMRRTAHGSTLSLIVHSWVLARAHRRGSWSCFDRALQSDICDIQGGTTPEGIHLGAMAGTVDVVQRCFTGIEIRDDVLWFNPYLPTALAEVRFRLRYRGRYLDVRVDHAALDITYEAGHAARMRIGVGQTQSEIGAGETLTFELERAPANSAVTV